MTTLAAVVVAGALTIPPPPGFVREPITGVTFAANVGSMSLLGVAAQRKTFLRLKVYAIGFYVADSALSGPLTVHRGRADTSAFYSDLVTGDFEKEVVLNLVRELSAKQIQDSFRDAMLSVDGRLLDQFVSYFAIGNAGQQCVLHWSPGGTLETTVAGVVKPAIRDRAFSQAVLAIWLGDRPQDDRMKKRLVSRTGQLIE
jgi:hypothetical protein